MELYVCSIRDAKSEAFGRPFCAQSLGQAIRSFEDEVNRAHEENIVYKHPDDFQLFALGRFDDSTGLFKCSEVPQLLQAGGDVKKKLDNVRHISKV